ncbi:MAG: multicopper oxidase domain-containing protein, partial [Streptomyces sp.]
MGALDRRGFNRRVLLGGAAVATSLSLAPEARSDTGPATAAPGGEVKRIKLYAEKLADGQMGYGLARGKATIPGPLIELNEGDTLHIEFENTMDVRASLHVHGLDYEISSDGTKLNKSDVEPGGTRT